MAARDMDVAQINARQGGSGMSYHGLQQHPKPTGFALPIAGAVQG